MAGIDVEASHRIRFKLGPDERYAALSRTSIDELGSGFRVESSLSAS